MAAGPETPMRVWKITNYTDSILLRTQSEDVRVDPRDPVLQRFVSRLHATVTDSASLGLGIAAPQVGILKNIIWVQRLDKEELPFEVYLNPRILQYSDKKQRNREGCLSIPNRADTCSRAYAILLEYDRIDGTHGIEMVEDFTSVIFQHEVDHLNGILYLDHLAEEQRSAEHAPVGRQ
ncbi:peptide deformylase [Lewinella sp. JB7]|uniref:peptide deformylase n=1 Tax=Lewinella sp. JB7 TaxID=2962887 RepID=UPI0020C957FD|nr:peptide deformylase [Lewinella sp. JB7]